MFALRSWLLVLGLLIPITCSAQFERVDSILSDIQNRFADAQGFIPTGGNVAGTVQEDIVEMTLIEPIQWELEKLEIQIELLRNSTRQQMAKIEEVAHRVKQVNAQLLEKGITSSSDLQAMGQRTRDMKHELEALAAQEAALKDAAEQRKDSRAAQLQIESAKLALDAEREKLKSARLMLEQAESLQKKAIVSSVQVEKTRAEFAEQEAAVRMAELNVEKQIAELDVVPGISDELRKIKAIRERLANQLKESNSEDGVIIDLQSVLEIRKQAEFKNEFSSKRLLELETALEKLELEKAYLSMVLARFRGGLSAVKPAEQEKATQEKDEETDK